MRDGGISVDRVIPGTAAERHGLQAGDIILSIDDMSTGSGGALRTALAGHDAGDTIVVDILRGDATRTIEIVLGARPSDLELRRDEADHVIDVLEVRPGDDVADIGCGTGWLSEAIATVLDGDGTVYAIELQEDHIERLRERDLSGIVPVHSKPDDVSIPENSIDIAMLHDVASHIDRDARPDFYDSVRAALRPGGRLVIFGPHGEAGTMLEVLRDNGFEPVDGEALDRLEEDELDGRLREGIVFLPAPTTSS